MICDKFFECYTTNQVNSMRHFWQQCTCSSSARLLVSTMTSSLYPASPTCKQPEICLSQCSTPNLSKLPKVDSSYGLNGNNYNFYTCHLHQGTVRQPKSSYNVSTYWLYSFPPSSGPQNNSNTNPNTSNIFRFGKKIKLNTGHLISPTRQQI